MPLGPPLAAAGQQPQLKRSASAALSRQNSAKSSRNALAGDAAMAMPRLARSRSFSGAEGKNTLVRQQTFNGAGELGNDKKLSFKRQRSQLGSAKGSTNVVTASSTSTGAARNFMFRNNSTNALARQDSQGGVFSSTTVSAPFAPMATSAPVPANSLRRKGSLYNALKK